MHEAALARAAVPEPTVCLRMLLRPLSLGHLIHLERAGLTDAHDGWLSPFDVPKAVLICSQSWEENCRASGDWLLGLKLAIWNWRTRHCDLRAEKKIFEEYLRQGSLSFKPSDAPRAQSPFERPGRLPPNGQG